MNEFYGKVAVVTGAASGIGRAIAARAAQEGMRVVLADIEADALERAAAELRATGADVLAVPTDVANAESVAALAERTIAAYGAVHLLFNNAGVAAGGLLWERTLADWEWVLGVNLWGVIHGIRSFVPLMLAQKDEGYIVNTASAAGLISTPALSIYTMTKHAVVALSETLSVQLAQQGEAVKVSVLCPMWVNTRIMESARNRPAALQNPSDAGSPAVAEVETFRHLVETGKSPTEIADAVFAAIRDERFYILTHPDVAPLVRRRMEAILDAFEPSV
jgi:NAD(P)-dependent dehydrogenase (short-subunit alcohol dehydrogenase family)